MPIIEVQNVSKIYRMSRRHTLMSRKGLSSLFRPETHKTFAALQDVSFIVDPGESVGIIGQNGSGKSTLLKLIAGVTLPSSGRVVVRGRVASLLELGAGFHGMLTGRENVYLNAGILGMRHAQVDAVFDQIVDFSGIAPFIDNPVDTYSSGMYVRLAFAVAVHVDPDVFLVDEVLSVGDEEFQRKCRRRIGELRESGKTILFVSHDLGIVNSLCERVILLSHGKTVVRSTAHEAIEFYLRMVGNPQGVCVLSQGDTEVVSSNGRISLFYKKHEVSTAGGFTMALRSLQQEHHSTTADWVARKHNEASCTTRGKMPRLPLSLVWDTKIEDDTVTLDLAIDCEREVPVDVFQADLMLPVAYQRWLYGDLEGAFPSIEPEDTSWTAVAAQEAPPSRVAAFPESEDRHPPLLAEVELHQPHLRLIWLNSDYVMGSRILQATARMPGSAGSLKPGRHELLTLRLYLSKGRDEIRSRFGRERTIASGPLTASFDRGRIRLAWNGQELTSLVHAYASILMGDLWNDSRNLLWTPIQRDGERLTITGSSRRFPFRQIWQIEPCDRGIKWNILLEALEPLDMQEYHASVALRPEYDRWETAHESGEFPPFTPDLEDWYHINHSYRPSPYSEARASSLPAVRFETDPKIDPFSMTVLNTGFSQNARVLQALRTPKHGVLSFSEGIHPYFSGRILVDGREEP